jgi:hypothetical protein
MPMLAEQCHETLERFTRDLLIGDWAAEAFEIVMFAIGNADCNLTTPIKTREDLICPTLAANKARPRAEPSLFATPFVLDFRVFCEKLVGKALKLAVDW